MLIIMMYTPTQRKAMFTNQLIGLLPLRMANDYCNAVNKYGVVMEGEAR